MDLEALVDLQFAIYVFLYQFTSTVRKWPPIKDNNKIPSHGVP